MTYAIGVDGGGTHTRAVCLDGSGAVLGSGTGGPSNHRRVGFDAAASAAISAARAAALEASTPLPVETACFALAGVGREAEHQQVLLRLLAADLAQRVTLVPDAEAALAGAIPEGPGIVVIAGTGAIAWGRDEAGKHARADGWGPLLGDWGSATWIGREALRAAVAAEDGRRPDTTLRARVVATLEVGGIHDLLNIPAEVLASRLADLALPCDEAAAGGDEVAMAILDAAAGHLAGSARAVAVSLGIGDACTVSWAGGVFGSERLRQTFSARLGQLLPHARIAPPVAEPVVGAGWLALKALQVPPAP